MEMHRGIAILAGIVLLLALPGSGQAQTSVEVEGTIQAVDCAAQSVVLSSPGGSNVVNVGPYTAVLVNSTGVSLCALRSYIGAYATAWLIAGENTFTATRIDVYASAAPQPSSPAPVPAYVAVPSLAGVVLGTIVVAGLVFLLVRGYDGRLYHYPYYGPYYRTYYRPAYRPYAGPLVGAPAYHYGPYRHCPDGAWSRWCR
jgi:hypothetical protein